MKKAIALLLSIALLASMMILPATAADGGVDAVAMVQALGIMNGGTSGDMNLSANVTRAEFAKMLVAASSFRDTVGGSTGYSLFKDVKKNFWAVEYIKVCVENMWFIGYADGNFRPNNTIKLEEAATAVLRLLGYTPADLAGSYPTAQLSKFDALGLHAGFSVKQGQRMTRGDCANLFYNLMAADAKAGQNYATTLGYKTDAAGNVDYASLVSANTKGPYTLASGTIAEKISFTPTAVYYNGKAATLGAAGEYDVYYYNANLRAVWIYSNQITGTYTAAAPSTAAPASVTVAGVSYPLESSAAAYKLSSQGQFGVGDTVTLLLGMNGGVADVCAPGSVSGVSYGIVRATQTQTQADANGKVTVTKAVQVACTDGVTRTFETGTKVYTKGTLVQISAGSADPVSNLSQRNTSGKVSADGASLGNLKFAAGALILDTDSDGNALRIYPARLAGSTLSSSQVLFYDTNTAGEITHMILRNTTGDLYAYGVLTDVTERGGDMALSGMYEYMIAGKAGAYTTTNLNFNVSVGPAQLRLDGAALAGAKNLTQIKLDRVSAVSASTGSGTFALSELCQVYIKKDNEYYVANLATVNGGGYTLVGYYDNLGYAAGKLIRVIIATAQ